MKPTKYYENYPYWMIILSNLLSLAIYFIGAIIIYRFGLIWLLIYLLYIIWLELRLLKGSCANCYYYGKYCAFGKGKLSCLFFSKGNSKKFIHKQITWKDIISDFMVFISPLIIGIIVLIMDFSWLFLALVVLLSLLGFVGNAIIRDAWACKYCKQRKIGCPAEKLFSKTKK
ncbi:MAG: hypothetical protein NT129_02480 [Candidatus Aenigmarchaeota archaeon]|nr:hypothetical protein [Candidatus Aenigmarchaeota archaeon]